jgi:NAD-dependent dihydropyrimidine dehydrogenase PreA subunit
MVKIDRNICDNCGTCVTVCPEKVLRIIAILENNTMLCTDCGRYIQVCPFGAITKK